MNALLKSKEYVKGKWGRVFSLFVFISGIFLIFSYIPTFIFSLLKIPFAQEISRFVVGLFLSPLIITYLFLIYSNLKALKGEFTFAPTVGKKASFIIISILGILFMSGLLFSTLSQSFGSAREKAPNAKQEVDLRQKNLLN
jgi:hypothetical protein